MNKPLSNSTNTREKILDAAESLFIELGFAATSLRAIASKAGVNLAATNYHFGSKNGLLAATIHRRVAPINKHRLELLQALVETGHPTTRSILTAFLQPVTEAFATGLGPALIGRVFSEPESLIRPIMEQEFGEAALSFQHALAGTLPGVSGEDLSWRFHFMVGSMVHLLKFQTPLGIDSNPSSFIRGMEQLINYSEAGLEQITDRQAND
jgi:AcrR family transcriptional regulator